MTVRRFAAAALCALLLSLPLLADEGMYPLSEIPKLDLHAKGIKLSPSDIYNPGGVGLIDAIVQVGGCTGSFISNDGLIITNHHCAFGIVQAASTTAHDYITDGYLAPTRADELPGKGVTVRITESYRDVSKELLAAAADTMDPAARTKAIDKAARAMIAAAEQANPGKRAEVAEMFQGRTYWLFIYTFIKDVRAVYVPPRGVGEFGGENDNWVWPRHTGDFSFLRAYVAPDGSPADYSPANVPYHPRKFLAVNPDGVDENDPVFVLGYPGRTFRHRPASYLSFEDEVRMPYIAGLYDWEIATMEALGKQDKATAIKVAGRIKSLANTAKNYHGKLEGIAKTGLIGEKQRQEKELQAFIDADASRKAAYGNVLSGMAAVYAEMRTTAERDYLLDNIRRECIRLSLASSLIDAVRERQKPDIEREGPFMDRNFTRTKEGYQLAIQNYDEKVDKAILKEFLQRAARLPKDLRIGAIDSLLGPTPTEDAIDFYIAQSYLPLYALEEKSFMEQLAAPPSTLPFDFDPFVHLARALAPAVKALGELRVRRDGTLNALMAKFVDVKELFLRKDFIPDANGTFRLTFGKIQGYSPADALTAAPITTVRGVLEKTTGVEPYNTPAALIAKYKAGEFGRYRHKRLKDIPVALLYNLDTTGGNSGSPVLNAAGEVVGVNFDRAYGATINDYAWSQDYSRSIGVDIRYVLWVTGTVAGADNLMREMGVSK